jgi:hypothetical protein
VEIALVLDELRHGDVLERDRRVGVGGDHRVAAAVIVGGGQDGLEIREHGVIDFDHVRAGIEIAEGDLPRKIRKNLRGKAANPTFRPRHGTSRGRAVQVEGEKR